VATPMTPVEWDDNQIISLWDIYFTWWRFKEHVPDTLEFFFSPGEPVSATPALFIFASLFFFLDSVIFEHNL
jgi:hypothetical protein